MTHHAPIRAAIVGLGRWGQTLVTSVSGKDGAGLSFTSGVTRTPAKAAQFCAEQGFPVSDDFERMLRDPNIDAVVLATPHSQHCRQICAAAQAGKHVFVEKPVTLTVAEAQKAIEVCNDHEVVLCAGFNRRFLPGYQALGAQLEAGVLGTPLHVDANFSGPFGYDYSGDMWRGTEAENPAGGMAAMGIHMLDAMIGLLGPVKTVSTLSRRRVLTAPIDDTTSVQLEFANGTSGSLTTLMATAPNWRFQLFGSVGWVALPDQESMMTHITGQTPERSDFGASDTLFEELKHFAACIRGSAKPIVTAQEILSGVAAMQAIASSAKQGGVQTKVERVWS